MLCKLDHTVLGEPTGPGTLCSPGAERGLPVGCTQQCARMRSGELLVNSQKFGELIVKNSHYLKINYVNL